MRWEPLLPGVEIALSRRCRFTTDSVLLSRFAAPKAREKAADLCSGSGIVPLLWYGEGETRPAHVWTVDRDEEAVALRTASDGRNGLAREITVTGADLRSLPPFLQGGGIDLVTCNPPYHPAFPGADSKTHETCCTVGDVCRAAAWLLRFGGRLCLCHRPGRLPEVFSAMRQHRITPKRLRMVAHRAGRPPTLALIEGRLGGGEGLSVEPELLLEEPDGSPTAEYRAAYRMG